MKVAQRFIAAVSRSRTYRDSEKVIISRHETQQLNCIMQMLAIHCARKDRTACVPQRGSLY